MRLMSTVYKDYPVLNNVLQNPWTQTAEIPSLTDIKHLQTEAGQPLSIYCDFTVNKTSIRNMTRETVNERSWRGDAQMSKQDSRWQTGIWEPAHWLWTRYGPQSHIQHFAPPLRGATFSIVLLFWNLHSIIFSCVLEHGLGIKSPLDHLRSQQNHPQVTTPSGEGGHQSSY